MSKNIDQLNMMEECSHYLGDDTVLEEGKLWNLGDGWTSDSDIIGDAGVEEIICSVVYQALLSLSDKATADKEIKKMLAEQDVSDMKLVAIAQLKKSAALPASWDADAVTTLVDDLDDVNYHRAVKYIKPVLLKLVGGK